MILVLILLVILVIDVGSVIDTRIKNTSRINSSMDLNFVPTYTPPPTLKPTIIITQKPTKTTVPTITPTLKPTISPTPAPTSTPKPTVASKPTATKRLSRKMKVSISCSCSGYNHVGNEWYKYFSIDNIQVKSGDKITVTLGESIEIYTSFTEDDKVPDVGSAWDNVALTQNYIKNGFSITQTIYVTENRGRYSGNTAVWTATYEFSP